MPNDNLITWHWQIDWPASPWLVILVFLVTVSLVILAYSLSMAGAARRVGLLLLRLLALLAVMVAICRMGIRYESISRLPLAILLDDSRSMSEDDEPAGHVKTNLTADHDQPETAATRFAAAKALLLGAPHNLLTTVERKFQVQVQLLSSLEGRLTSESPQSVLQSAVADGKSTPLADRIIALLEAAGPLRLNAMLILSDGHSNQGRSLEEAAARAAQDKVSLFCVGMGGQIQKRKLRITDLVMDSQAIVGDLVVAELQIDAIGYSAETLRVQARHADNQQVLDQTEVVVGQPASDAANAGAGLPTSHRVILAIPAKSVGQLPVQFRVITASRPHAVAPDAQRTRVLTIVDQTTQALLVSSVPSYEFRAIKEVLSRAAWQTTIGEQREAEKHRVPAGRPGSSAAQGSMSRPAEIAGAASRGADATLQTLQLRSVLFSAEPDIERIESGITSTLADDWSDEVDVVILSDVAPEDFSEADQHQLVDFVMRGRGGVALVAGPMSIPWGYEGAPLSRLFPSLFADLDYDQHLGRGTPFQFLPTRLGLTFGPMQLERESRGPTNWLTLPSLTWSVPMKELIPGVRVIADGRRVLDSTSTGPLATLQFVGSGRVLFHATDEAWRWRYRRSDRELANYWRQMIRYLARGKYALDEEVVLRTKALQFRADQSVILEAYFPHEASAPAGDQELRAAITRRDGFEQQVELTSPGLRRNLWTTVVDPLPPGYYTARLAMGAYHAQSTFDVQPHDPEMADTSIDHQSLRDAANRTDGRFATSREVGKLIASLAALDASHRELLRFEPLLQPWQIATVLCGALCIEWLLRLRWQLP